MVDQDINKKKARMTIAELARLAGVSKTTASFILSGRAEQHRISQPTCERVLTLAKQYNFRPNISAKALRSRRTFTIGLVIPDLTNYGFAATAKALDNLCRQSGYQLLIASSDDDPALEQEQVTSLVARQVDGLIVASAMAEDAFYRQLDCPVVQIDRCIDGSTLPVVMTDAEPITAEVVAHILQVQKCETLAYIGGQTFLSSEQHRYRGYLQGLTAANQPLNKQLVSRGRFTSESGYQQIADMVAAHQGKLPQGIFCSSFTLMEGVLRYLKEHDLLNEPCHLATFDNHDLLDCLPIAVDSITQDCTTMASEAFQILIDREGTNGEQPAKTKLRTLLPAQPHWRSTR